jgi:hypothetical protein
VAGAVARPEARFGEVWRDIDGEVVLVVLQDPTSLDHPVTAWGDQVLLISSALVRGPVIVCRHIGPTWRKVE